MTGGAGDPLAAVASLTGVGSAAAAARDAIDALLRHPRLRREAAAVAAASAARTARADVELEGLDSDAPDDGSGGAVLRGSLRVGAELLALARTWERAPLQALARVHLLAARDLAPAADLGRLTTGGERIADLAWLVTAPTAAPAVVVAAVVHAELATLAPFGSADRLVARAVEHVVLVARGVDTAAVTVPAAGHLALQRAYGPLLEAYAAGTAAGVAAWVRHCCEAYAIGAEVVARDLSSG